MNVIASDLSKFLLLGNVSTDVSNSLDALLPAQLCLYGIEKQCGVNNFTKAKILNTRV